MQNFIFIWKTLILYGFHSIERKWFILVYSKPNAVNILIINSRICLKFSYDLPQNLSKSFSNFTTIKKAAKNKCIPTVSIKCQIHIFKLKSNGKLAGSVCLPCGSPGSVQHLVCLVYPGGLSLPSHYPDSYYCHFSTRYLLWEELIARHLLQL